MPKTATRVLVVDDDNELRETLESVLVSEGFDVEAASNGLEALSVLPGWHPDLIILDLLMPIMDGWRFRAEQLQTASAQVPVLVLTGHLDATSTRGGLDAVETVQKPFALDELLDAIRRITRL